MTDSENAEISETGNTDVDIAEKKWPDGVFKMPRSTFFITMTRLYGRSWIIGMILALVCGAILGICTADIRWFIVMLMIIFIVFPMLAAFLYFSHGLRPESFFNVVPHRLEEGEEGLVAVLYREIKSDKESDPASADETEEECQLRLEESGRIALPYRGMRPYFIGSNSVTIPIGKGLIWISEEAFGKKEIMQDFLIRISKNIRHQSRH